MTDNPHPATTPQRQGTIGGPSVSLIHSARRHWGLVVAPILLFVVAAGFIGLKRDAVYTATTRMNVGRLDSSSPGAVAGFSTATQALASAYSRAVHAEQVVASVAHQLGLSARSVNRRVYATPLPLSPVFEIKGRGRNPQAAIALANATASTLISYLTSLNRSNPDSPRLFRNFTTAALDVQRRARVTARLDRAAINSPTPGNRAAADQAHASLEAAVLYRETERALYQSSQQGQSSTSLVQVLARATTASSDRSSRLELLLFLAVAAGLLLGLALATLQASRQMALATRR